MSPSLRLLGVPVYTSKYAGELVTPEMPAARRARLKRYKQRAIKRWQRAHPPYYRAQGLYWLIGDGAILCHPNDLTLLTTTLMARVAERVTGERLA